MKSNHIVSMTNLILNKGVRGKGLPTRESSEEPKINRRSASQGGPQNIPKRCSRVGRTSEVT